MLERQQFYINCEYLEFNIYFLVEGVLYGQ